MWLIPKSLGYPSSPESAASTWGSKLLWESWAIDGVLPLTWRGKPILVKSCSGASMQATCLQHLSGQTLPPSQAVGFEGWWTSSLAARRARHSARLHAGATEESGTCGTPLSTSCSTLNRAGYSQRTWIPRVHADVCEGCAATSIAWDITSRHTSARRPRKSAAATTDVGSGFWPTPTAKANHLSPSMRKWPAYAAFQDSLGRGCMVKAWEYLMNFPPGWTDSGR
jgi:hypothetical protein